jgi:hypothetical protein
VQWGARASWAHEEYVAITGTGYVETPVGMVIGWKQLGNEAESSNVPRYLVVGCRRVG